MKRKTVYIKGNTPTGIKATCYCGKCGKEISRFARSCPICKEEVEK